MASTGTGGDTLAATGETGRREIKVTTSDGGDYIDRHTAVLAPAFATDPVFMYMLSDMETQKRDSYQPHYMRTLLRASMLNDGVFVEADDWSSAAVWMPLGKRVDNGLTMIQAGILGVLWNVGFAGTRRMMIEFGGQTEKLKAKFLVDAKTGKKLSRYHYLWFIGTDEKARGRGLASHLIRLKQEEVKQGDRLPIWLEATTGKSRDVYAKCGFRQVAELKLGVGTHANTGLHYEGAEGLRVYAMIWRPEWEDEGKTEESKASDVTEEAVTETERQT